MFKKYKVHCPNYEAEYASLEDARKDVKRLPNYFDVDTALVDVWEVTYNNDGKIEAMFLLD